MFFWGTMCRDGVLGKGLRGFVVVRIAKEAVGESRSTCIGFSLRSSVDAQGQRKSCTQLKMRFSSPILSTFP